MPSPKKRKKSSKVQRSSRSPRRSFSLALIVIGIIFLVIPSLFHLNQTIQLMYFTPHVSAEIKSSLPVPTHISIPNIKLSLPIKSTRIAGNTWSIANDAISYLAISSRPTEKGAIILYSHNTDNRFGPIRWLKTGDKIVVRTANNKTYDYVVKETKEVSPNDVSVFQQKNETLILYTCSGFADTKRFIVIARPISSELPAF